MFIKLYRLYKKLKDAPITALLNINKIANIVEQNVNIHFPEIKLNLNPNQKTIFIIVDFLINGGVETRLFKIKRFLEKKDYNIVFIFANAHRQNYNDGFNYELLNLNIIFLNINSNLFLFNLLKLVNLYQPSVIEFQFKWFLSINYKFLKQFCDERQIKLNCTIHGIFFDPARVIQFSEYFHNVIFIGNYIYYDYEDYENFEKIKKHISHRLILNGITNISKIPKQIISTTNKDVLMISRIDYDKLNSITCAVEFCKKHNLNVFFLGTAIDNVKKRLISEYDLSRDNFLGHFDTYEYIDRNYSKYLFIIGVDQVAMEIGGMGIPLLISTYSKEIIFLKKNNYRNLSLNFGFLSKKYVSDLRKDKNYVKTLEENARKDLQKILNNELDEFDLHDIFVKERNFFDILEKNYLKTLENE